MSVNLNPYINFHGQARPALAFYQSVFGGQVTMSTFADFKMVPPDTAPDNVMHGQLTGDNGIVFMVSDAMGNDSQQLFASDIQLSLSGNDQELLTSYFENLSAAGKVTVPLDKAPWGDIFGMLTDQFGVNWMINIVA